MKSSLCLIVVSLALAMPLRSQTPNPDPAAEYVVVIGVSEHPTLVAYTLGMKLRDAVAVAGDGTLYANPRRVDLIRCGKKESFNYKAMRSDPSKEPVLQPWDVIYQPRPIF